MKSAPQINSKAISQSPYHEISHPANIQSDCLQVCRKITWICDYAAALIRCFRIFLRAGYLKAVRREYVRAGHSRFFEHAPPSPGDPLRSTGPAPRSNLHEKSALQTNAKAILQCPYREISHPKKIFSQIALRYQVNIMEIAPRGL